jgi:polar amino acid transport system substrate-binding protein
MKLFEPKMRRCERAKSTARTRLAVLIPVGVAAGVAAIFLHIWRSDASLARFQNGGVLRIGYAVESPYAFVGANGRVTGVDPEVARAIAHRLGIQSVEWELIEFRSLIDGLNLGRYDVIAAGMFITPERERRVAFSRPTIRVRPALLVQKGNPQQLHAYADILRRNSVRIAVLTGSVEEKQLLQIGVPVARLVQVPDARSGRILVETAQVDGLALSAPTIRWMIVRKTVTRAEMAEPFLESGPADGQPAQFTAFAFRKKDRALRDAWNREWEKFAGSPEHLRLVGQFGFSAADIPLGTANKLQTSPL